VWDFIREREDLILFNALQHLNLVAQAVLLATVIAVLVAVLVVRVPALRGPVNAVSAIGLTIPGLALVGLMLAFTGIQPISAFVAVTFYAILPVLRNAVVGLQGVDPTLLESARGMGMGPLAVLWRVRLPLAWPVILAGVRTSTQMSMGIAAIAAYILGPGLGAFIFTGLAQIGGANALNYAVVGTVGIIVVALVADLFLLLLGRLTISKGITA
jgi:osmoprotectant transport system permease protein